jgi:raffinose/stachyose/melibiose transport system permease protein
VYRSYILEYRAGYAAAISLVALVIALILSSVNLYIQSRDDY